MSTSHPIAESSPHPEATHERISRGVRLATLAVIIVPFLGLLAAAVFLWGWGFSWIDLGLLLGMYLLTGIGITVGFHRLFVHRSFAASTGAKSLLATLGWMAREPPLTNVVRVL